MGDRRKHIWEYKYGKFSPDVSALYPAIRSAAIRMLASLNDTMQAVFWDDDVGRCHNLLIQWLLGGSAALDDGFLHWRTMSEGSQAVGFGVTSAVVCTDHPCRCEYQNMHVKKIPVPNVVRPKNTFQSRSLTSLFVFHDATRIDGLYGIDLLDGFYGIDLLLCIIPGPPCIYMAYRTNLLPKAIRSNHKASNNNPPHGLVL
jgi:hypothetical protein